MPKVLISNNGELLRHFTAAPFKRLDLQLLVAQNTEEARVLFEREEPALAVLDVEQGGFETARVIKEKSPSTRVILVAGKRLTGDQMRQVSSSGCDELLIAPMTADELHDVVAIQLGEPRPGTEAFAISVEVAGKQVDATVSNLSVDGVRLLVAEPVTEGQPIEMTIAQAGEQPIVIRGNVVWVQPRDGKTVVGLAFDKLEERVRSVLAKLTQWQVVRDGERTRVVLRGDFTEATRFDDLLPGLVGRVVFDTAQVTYMNSLGVRAWCEFLRQARIQGYEFHACSVPFILQASMVRDVIGRGTVTSFFAPFHCISCDHQEERLLQSAAILAASFEPPIFKCPSCGGALEFDDLPERYFAFLEDEVD
ncbi:MAG: response regulator receiver modulated PilZ sensor protein [Deltaproteobacteria bacterium]|nr:response regulator receiver modulated PilZ sensor protein [Deltaproteobacteria bacterium]